MTAEERATEILSTVRGTTLDATKEASHIKVLAILVKSIQSAERDARARAIEECLKELQTSVSDLGGWLDSPKAVLARIALLKGGV